MKGTFFGVGVALLLWGCHQTSPLDRGKLENENMLDDPGIDAASRGGSVLHVSYVGGPDRTLHYASNASGAWEIEDLGFASRRTDIAVDETGRVHIVFEEPDPNRPDRRSSVVHVAMKDSAWVATKIDDSGHVPSMAVDSRGRAHVVYAGDYEPWEEIPYEDLTYASSQGEGGEFLVEEIGRFRGDYAAIALDAADRPHVVSRYKDGLEHRTQKGGEWIVQTVEADERAGFDSCVAVDEEGYVHVSYLVRGASKELHCATNRSGAWTVEVVEDVQKVMSRPFLAIDSKGYRHVVYRSFAADGGGSASALAYLRDKNGIWQLETIELDGYFRGNPMKLDPQDHAHIIYQGRYDNLGYVTNESGKWERVEIDAGIVDYDSMAMALENRGRL